MRFTYTYILLLMMACSTQAYNDKPSEHKKSLVVFDLVKVEKSFQEGNITKLKTYYRIGSGLEKTFVEALIYALNNNKHKTYKYLKKCISAAPVSQMEKNVYLACIRKMALFSTLDGSEKYFLISLALHKYYYQKFGGIKNDQLSTAFQKQANSDVLGINRNAVERLPKMETVLDRGEYEISIDNKFNVFAYVNGKKLKLNVDSGAMGYLWLSKKKAREIGLKPTGITYPFVDAFRGVSRMSLYTGEVMRFGPLVIKHPYVYVIEKMNEKKQNVDGFIGIQSLLRLKSASFVKGKIIGQFISKGDCGPLKVPGVKSTFPLLKASVSTTFGKEFFVVDSGFDVNGTMLNESHPGRYNKKNFPVALAITPAYLNYLLSNKYIDSYQVVSDPVFSMHTPSRSIKTNLKFILFSFPDVENKYNWMAVVINNLNLSPGVLSISALISKNYGISMDFIKNKSCIFSK